MTAVKNLGIWMNHSTAHLMEFSPNFVKTELIALQSLQNEVPHQSDIYLKKIGDIILNYESVILFGPTDAKLDLLYIIIGDYRFANVKIQIKQTSDMTEYQEHCFVRDYFLRH
jgi:hypothetical protein